MKVEIKCRDYGDPSVPGCLGDPDERYTTYFDDIGEAPIYWCAHCGPIVQRQWAVIEEALRVPGFQEKFEKLLTEAEAKCERRHN